LRALPRVYLSFRVRAVCSDMTGLLAVIANRLRPRGVCVRPGPVGSLVTSLRRFGRYRYLLVVLEIVLEPIFVST
jgi:hypothetical protein